MTWSASRIKVERYYMGGIAAEFWAPCVGCNCNHGPYDTLADAQDHALCTDCEGDQTARIAHHAARMTAGQR
jgi:hypothetical protein